MVIQTHGKCGEGSIRYYTFLHDDADWRMVVGNYCVHRRRTVLIRCAEAACTINIIRTELATVEWKMQMSFVLAIAAVCSMGEPTGRFRAFGWLTWWTLQLSTGLLRG
jgi:hypothetical protein